MPTVRNGIDPLAMFPMPRGKTQVKRLTVFPAEHWEEHGGKPGKWRVMLGEAWVCRDGEKVSFFTEEGLRQIFADWGLRAMGVSPRKAVAPTMAKGTKVLVRASFPKEPGMHWIASSTRSKPFQDDSGEWRVWVFFRPRPVLLEALERLEDGSGYRLIEP